MAESFNVIIIGAGMCGIACGAGLKTFGIDNFVILEKGNVINNFWKNHTYDRMALHTPYHDVPFDGGLVYNYPQMKDKNQLTDYLQKYAAKYKVNHHIKFGKKVIMINKVKNEWIIHTKDGEDYYCTYLCIATSSLCEPNIPHSLQETMHNFTSNNGIIHSIQYKNGEQYANENVLIVGNGDSAFEIAVDLVSYAANKVTLISPIGRHVVRLSDLNRTLFKLFAFAKKLGIIDIIMSNVFTFTPKHPKWSTYFDLIAYGLRELDNLSIDLSEYGIPKPTEKVFECNVSGNLQVLDWDGKDSCVDLIMCGRISCIYDLVVGFNEPNLIEIGNNKILNEYDSVILCTGYSHGLKSLFNKKLYDMLFEQSSIYKNWGIVPKTNGYNQSTVDKSLFFVGLLGDYSVLSGFANGYWGWEVARTIAKDKCVYDRKNEPSTWNPYTTKRMIAFVTCITGLFGTAAYIGFKAYKKYNNNSNE